MRAIIHQLPQLLEYAELPTHAKYIYRGQPHLQVRMIGDGFQERLDGACFHKQRYYGESFIGLMIATNEPVDSLPCNFLLYACLGQVTQCFSIVRFRHAETSVGSIND